MFRFKVDMYVYFTLDMGAFSQIRFILYHI